jgi:hypothetical protein
MRDLGLKPSQLGLLILDEPSKQTQYDFITTCAKIIRKAAPDILLFEDPAIHERSDSLETMMSHVDIVCPYGGNWLSRPQWYRDLLAEQQAKGKQLWFYDTWPTARVDPYTYYVLRGWSCYAAGAKGSAYWSFISTQGASAWNQYAARRGGSYCPVYLDDGSVTPAKYMEAIREGVQDYEYLVMLRGRIAALEKRGVSGDTLSRAKALHAGACERVLKGVKTSPEQFGVAGSWADPTTDRTVADAVRTDILETLTELLAAGP